MLLSANFTEDTKFTTECFFLTIQCQNICLQSLVNSMSMVQRHLGELRRSVDVTDSLLVNFICFQGINQEIAAIGDNPNPQQARELAHLKIDQEERLNSIKVISG